MSNDDFSFSVLMSVYHKEQPVYLKRALDSVINQTLPPNEIVLVEDGPLTDELYAVIDQYTNNHPGLFNIVKLEQNQGLGLALREGVVRSTYDLIARMDTDDVSVPNRFELQIKELKADPSIEALGGGCMGYFDGKPMSRYWPPATTDEGIKEVMKKKCACSHVTMMLKKDAVLRAGNYMHLLWDEDYYLWVRMMVHGCVFKNINDPLVNVYQDKATYGRRGGMKYFRSEKAVQKYMWENKIISLPRYIYNVSLRFFVQVMLTSSMRAFIAFQLNKIRNLSKPQSLEVKE